MAVMMPTNAVIPNAIIAMVMPLRKRLLRMVRKESERTSAVFMPTEDKLVEASQTKQMIPLKKINLLYSQEVQKV